jgi:hypothetical protein
LPDGSDVPLQRSNLFRLDRFVKGFDKPVGMGNLVGLGGEGRYVYVKARGYAEMVVHLAHEQIG